MDDYNFSCFDMHVEETQRRANLKNLLISFAARRCNSIYDKSHKNIVGRDAYMLPYIHTNTALCHTPFMEITY